MKNIKIFPKLSKDYILSCVSQEAIMSRYLNVSEAIIQECISTNKLIRNTEMREDHLATLGFKYNGNRLRARDFNGYFWGDCFDVVAYFYNLNTKEIDFIKILDIIAKDFNLHIYEDEPKVFDYTKTVQAIKNDKARTNSKITYAIRDFNNIDAAFWSRIHFTKGDLLRYKIFAVSKIWIDDDLSYIYQNNNLNDIAYVYLFGKNEEGLEKVQVYFPNRKIGRFRTNFSGLLGQSLIRENKILLLTKSYKDICCLNKIMENNFPIEVDAPSSENYPITKHEFTSLWQRYDYIFTLMDFDKAGQRYAHKLRVQYDMIPLFFTNGKRGSKINYFCKDFAEYVEKEGEIKSFNLIKKSYEYLSNKYEF